MEFDFEKDPLENFLKSIHQAEIESVVQNISDFNAMALSTAKDNKPSSRMVLFKGLVRGGFSFYTHYNGRKGCELSENNNVAATFFWPYLDHQINVKGQAFKLTVAESDAYFESRARQSQIGAWASQQSRELKSREDFEEKIKFFENKFKDQTIPRPDNWGGWHILPLEIEFWFAQVNRLHYRYVYHREDVNHEWQRRMRYP